MAEALHVVGPTAFGTSDAALYTVPASTTFIVRNVHVVNTSASTQTFRLGAHSSALTAATAFAWDRAIEPAEEYDWGGFWVVTTGQILRGHASATSVTVWLSGTLWT